VELHRLKNGRKGGTAKNAKSAKENERKETSTALTTDFTAGTERGRAVLVFVLCALRDLLG
jgi:hypothetical protein